MRQFEIRRGSRVVIVTEQGGSFSARMYVNDGETATQMAWKGKTEDGLLRWTNLAFAYFDRPQPAERSAC